MHKLPLALLLLLLSVSSVSANRQGTRAQISPVKATKAKARKAKAASGHLQQRASLATLNGIFEGRRYTLVNPSTGRVDANAKVISRSINKDTQIPFAKILFSNGYVTKFAAERLHLVGKPFSFQKKYIKQRRAGMFSAIEHQLGVTPKNVRLVSLRGQDRAPAKDPKSLRERGPFLNAYASDGDPLGPNEGVDGFACGKTAYVTQHASFFDVATPIHEVLHGMSEDFSDQMMDKGLVNAMEGLTEYFTYRVTKPHYGVEAKKDDPYTAYTQFATGVVKVVGEKDVKKIFFGEGKKLVKKLAKKYDAAVGVEGAFKRQARLLEDE